MRSGHELDSMNGVYGGYGTVIHGDESAYSILRFCRPAGLRCLLDEPLDLAAIDVQVTCSRNVT